MFEDVNWEHGEEHMFAKHHLTAAQANEALRDPDRVIITPDYASRSGLTSRVIGYSHTVGDLLTIIVIEDDGHEYGVNGWLANAKDRHIYREEESDDE
jgi:hypothetical protein